MGVRTMTDGEWRRTVHCKDGIGRDRALSVALSPDGQLMLAAPAGEVAYLDLGTGGDQLKRCVDDARLAAVELQMGLSPSAPTMSGLLQGASTFYVLDREDRPQALGIGLHESRVAANGPRGFWQVGEADAVRIGNTILSLAQTLRRR